jgi:hypothetical protein
MSCVVLTGCSQDQDGTPDDGQQDCSKHVEVYYWNKSIENSASCWFISYGYTRDYSLSQSKYQVLGIMAYPNQNTTYHGSSSSSQQWSLLRHTWHWTRSRSSFEPQKMNPASASCKQTINYTRHSAAVCLSGRNRLHIYMVEKSVTICTILPHNHPDPHSTPFALNSVLWPFTLFQHPTLTAQKLTKSHTCSDTTRVSTMIWP